LPFRTVVDVQHHGPCPGRVGKIRLDGTIDDFVGYPVAFPNREVMRQAIRVLEQNDVPYRIRWGPPAELSGRARGVFVTREDYLSWIDVGGCNGEYLLDKEGIRYYSPYTRGYSGPVRRAR